MPVWADVGNPPGPLNYRADRGAHRVPDRRPTNETYIIRDEHLLEPKIDPVTGEVLTFTGWRDPNYERRPRRDAVPGVLGGRVHGPGRVGIRRRRRPVPPRRRRPARPASSVEISATTPAAFDQTEVSVPADTAFQIQFDNKDAGVPHNVAIKDATGRPLFTGEIITGAGRDDTTTSRRCRPGRTRSCAPCTRT